MSKGWQVIGAFIVVFLAGGAVGIVFTLSWLADHVPAAHAAPEPNAHAAPQEFNVQMLRRWINEGQLDLTPEQRQRILPILNEAGEDVQRLIRENQHSAILIIEHMQDEVELVLTPGQRLKFDDLRAKQHMRVQLFQQQQRQRLRKLEAEGAY